MQKARKFSRYDAVLCVVTLLFFAPFIALFSGLFFMDTALVYTPSNQLIIRYVQHSVELALGATLLATLLGVVSAWCVVFYEFPFRRYIQVLLFMPLAVPGYIAAFVYAELLEYAGPLQTFMRDQELVSSGSGDVLHIRSMWGAICVLAFVLYPYVYGIMLLQLRRFRELFYSMRCLGVSGWKLFVNIAIRAQRPALVAGGSLVAMEVISDFGVVDYFAIDTLTTAIYDSWFGFNEKLFAIKLAVYLMIAVAVVLVIERINRKNIYSYQNIGGNHALVRLSARWRFLMMLVCMVPIMIGVVIPVVRLLMWASTMDLAVSGQLYNIMMHSFTVAFIAALVTVIVVLFLLFLKLYSSAAISKHMTDATTLGYAVPGTVIAIAVLWSFGWLDQQLGQLFFSGTFFALVFAYSVRFLKVAMNPIDSEISVSDKELFFLLRIVPVSWQRRFKQGYFPLFRSSIAVAFIFVFIESIKELPATLVIRPFNFETLATYSYQLASDERVYESSLPALLIVAIATIPVYALWRRLYRTVSNVGNL